MKPLSLLVLLLVVWRAQAACTGTIGGQSYDISALVHKSGADYHLVEAVSSNANYDWWFNVCDNVIVGGSPSCGTAALAYQREQGSGSCQKVAVAGAGTWALMNPQDTKGGIAVTFGGGDKCGHNQQVRQVTFNFKCDNTKSPGTPLSVAETPIGSCKSYGCPGGGGANPGSVGALSAGWYLIIFSLVGLSLYCGAGILYKVKKLGVSGTEAIPNIEFWRDVPTLVKDGSRFTVAKMRGGTGSSTYETV